ncbi:gastrula zinc finger protein xFG20-1-like [Frieseomelitta varia]|uniref:gastrula zinc finger protein xFG20-1-like n=1 Tax=Frieseomelitta varia TaxID=561572 RepID=UPI001CB6B2A2|nr:gastrula zinc finger protein xFG20-1-like [Frieseomelitta varia]
MSSMFNKCFPAILRFCDKTVQQLPTIIKILSTSACIIPMIFSKKMWWCSQCGKRYMWRDSLKKHLRVECGKDPTFECPICGRKFKHKHRWQSHAKLIHYVTM